MGKPVLRSFLKIFSVKKISLRTAANHFKAEYIGFKKQTRGSETSQYPEEKKSTETPLVVASERGPGQCLLQSNQNDLEKSTAGGESPVWVRVQ